MKSQITLKVVTGTKLSASEIADQLIDTARLIVTTSKEPETKDEPEPGFGLIGKVCYGTTVARLIILQKFKTCKKFINAAW